MKFTTNLYALGAAALAGALGMLLAPQAAAAEKDDTGSGALMRTLPDGRLVPCPLKHTDVFAEISGPMAMVRVRQDFVNESNETIEAVYNFPLPVLAAVNGYSMQVNDRKIKGKIARREDAQKAFEEARRQGKTAALLNQQRPNVFQQSVTNIPPGGKVSVEVFYVELVPYEAGTYEFVFPMVVGPRYFPAHMAQAQSSVNPPYSAKGTRAGHDIAVEVKLNKVGALAGVSSVNHSIDQKHQPQFESIRLATGDQIPNKDFILRYRTADRQIAPALLTHAEKGQGFFSFVIDPPAARSAEVEPTPKELVFAIDVSGSMHGFPLDKAKECMMLAIEGMNPRDTFNLIVFEGATELLFDKPQPATPENITRAKRFLEFRQGSGGTEMMKAVRAALDGTDAQDHVRIVCFMTDGHVGNENEIISEIRRHPNARVFSFGIGSSVNRFLLDKMAEAGRGEVEYVSLNDDGSAAAKRFHERVRNPLLTDVKLEFNGVAVEDVVPARIPDLFSAKPIIVSGRYASAGKGKLKLSGKMAGRAWSREIDVVLPAENAANSAVPSIWARRKIDSLSIDEQANREAITKLGLDFRLMTSFTSFYAVEERVVNEGGQVKRIDVPVEMPDGVSHEYATGNVTAKRATFLPAAPLPSIGLYSRSAPRPQEMAAADSLRRQRVEPKEEVTPAGRIEVRILLKAVTAANLKALKDLGFLPAANNPAGALFLRGSLDASKLEQVKKLDFVVRVEPLV